MLARAASNLRAPSGAWKLRDERVIGVFLASPSDLEPERNRLEEVVEELNRTWGRSLSIRLDLVRWETHGYPGIGKDAQDVINQQLPDDYDIFVGLMWGRFGTPTGRAGSGTEEEYLRALERFRSNPEQMKVMFYFKDAPLSPSSIDPDQLKKVQSFRRSLGEAGTLHWSFTSMEDFASFLRIHLSRQVQELVGNQKQGPKLATIALMDEATGKEDDAGLIDLFDLAEGYFADISQILGRMTADADTLASKITERGRDIASAVQRAGGNLDRHSAKALIDRAAEDMNRYVIRVRAELPLFRESLRKGADTAARASLMAAEMNTDKTAARAAMVGLNGLAKTLVEVRETIGVFKSTVRAIPRMTSALNRAKRECAEVSDEIMESLAEGRSLLLEAAKSIEVLVDQEHLADPSA